MLGASNFCAMKYFTDEQNFDGMYSTLLWFGQEQEGETNESDLCFTVLEMKTMILPTHIQTL